MDFGELAGINKYTLKSISVNMMSLVANVDLFMKKSLSHLPGVINGASDS